jgi:6,7-dimethyl-8-ribityllumazine synthase
LNVQTDIPVIFCVLTYDATINRSKCGIHGNKGTEAAIAAIKMAFIRQQASLTHQNQNLPTGPLRIDKGLPLELKE